MKSSIFIAIVSVGALAASATPAQACKAKINIINNSSDHVKPISYWTRKQVKRKRGKKKGRLKKNWVQMFAKGKNGATTFKNSFEGDNQVLSPGGRTSKTYRTHRKSGRTFQVRLVYSSGKRKHFLKKRQIALSNWSKCGQDFNVVIN